MSAQPPPVHVTFDPGPPPKRRRVGGTDIAILLGIPSFGSTPLDVYNRIVLGISKFQGNVYSDRGNKYEAHVREQYVARTGALLRPHPGVICFGTDVDKVYPFAASLDDIAERAGHAFPVDYKTASIKGIRKWGPDKSDGIPANYLCQLQWYCLALEEVFGIVSPYAELYAAFGTDVQDAATGDFTGEFKIEEYRHYVISRDRDAEAEALEAGRKFWREHVLPRIPPVDPKTAEADRYAQLIASPPPKGTEMSLFARLSNPGATASAPPPPAVTTIATPSVTTTAPVTPAETSPAGIDAQLRAQTPAEPDDEVAQVIPPDAATLEQALTARDAEDAATAPARAEAAVSAVEPGKRGRGRPRKTLHEAMGEMPSNVLVSPTPLTSATPAPAAGTPTQTTLTGILNDQSAVTTIYVNVPAIRATPLAPYISGLDAKLRASFEVQDISVAPERWKDPTTQKEGKHPLAFGGWKGMVRALVRASPPPAGAYSAPEFANEIAHEVLAALELAGAVIVRGAR